MATRKKKTTKKSAKKTAKKKAPTLSARVSQLEKHFEVLGTSHDDSVMRLNCVSNRADAFGMNAESLQAQYSSLDSRLDQITDGLGGIKWMTQEGHARWIAVLTTPHLENIFRGNFGSRRVREKVRDELNRRGIDREYRDGTRTVETKQQMTARKCDEITRSFSSLTAAFAKMFSPQKGGYISDGPAGLPWNHKRSLGTTATQAELAGSKLLQAARRLSRATDNVLDVETIIRALRDVGVVDTVELSWWGRISLSCKILLGR